MAKPFRSFEVMSPRGDEASKEKKLNVFEGVSPDFRKAVIKKIQAVEFKERSQKRKDRVGALALRLKAESALDVQQSFMKPDETPEQKIYIDEVKETFKNPDDNSEEGQEILRDKMHGILFHSQVYGAHIEQWETEYKTKMEDPKFAEQYPAFEDYVQEKGRTFLHARTDEIFKERLDSQKDLVSDKDAQKEQKFKKITEFFKLNRDQFLNDALLDPKDPNKGRLYKQFLADIGLEDNDQVKKFYGEISGDAESAGYYEMKFLAANGQMMEAYYYAKEHNLPIDEEAWEKMIQQAYYTTAVESVKHPADDKKTTVLMTEAPEIGQKPDLQTPYDVAQYAGVNIVGGDLEHGYIVQYPSSSLRTVLFIEKPKDDKDFNNAKIRVKNPYMDSGKGGEMTLDTTNLRAGFNGLFMEYDMNYYIQHNIVAFDKNKVPLNHYVTDDRMTQIAEKLYARDMDRLVISPTRRHMFQALMVSLIRDDAKDSKYGNMASLEKKVQVLMTAMDRPQLAGEMRRLLEHDPVEARKLTMTQLLERVGYVPLNNYNKGSEK